MRHALGFRYHRETFGIWIAAVDLATSVTALPGQGQPRAPVLISWLR